MRAFTSLARQLLVLTVVAMLTLSIASCGGSDSDDDAAQRPATTDNSEDPQPSGENAPPDGDTNAERNGAEAGDPQADGSTADSSGGSGVADDTPTGGSAEEARVIAVVKGMYRDLAGADAPGVCAAMSKKVQEQIAQQVPGGSPEAPEARTCEESFSKFLAAAATSGVLESTLQAEVSGARVKGKTATATVTIGDKGGKVRLIREDGTWRFGAAPVGSQPGG